MPAGHATVTGATANITMIDQLTEHDRIELLARAQDAWDRAPQNTMGAVFEWRGKNYEELRRLSLVVSAAHPQ